MPTKSTGKPGNEVSQEQHRWLVVRVYTSLSYHGTAIVTWKFIAYKVNSLQYYAMRWHYRYSDNRIWWVMDIPIIYSYIGLASFPGFIASGGVKPGRSSHVQYVI